MIRLTTIALFLTVWSSSALAKIIVIEIGKDVEREVLMWPGHTTTISLPEPATHTALGNKIDYWDTKSDSRHYALDIKSTDPPPTNFNLETWSGNAVLRIHAAKSMDDAVLHIRFVYPPRSDDSGPPVLTPDQARSMKHRAVADYTLQTTDVLTRYETAWHKGAHALELRVGHISQGAEICVFPFTVLNTGDYPYPILGFELQDHKGEEISASVHSAKDTPLGENLELPVGATFRGVFVLEKPVPLDKGWTLQLVTPEAIPAASFRSQTRRKLVPGMLELRTLVEVHGLGGAGKLSDNMGLGQSAWGAVTGAGVRVAYGPSKHTAIVGGIDFMQTAAASIDMPAGPIETSAVGGRLHFAGRLHTGEEIVPYAQAGLGLMMANHTFDAAGGGDDEFRVAMYGSIGGGVEAWFGERWVVGLGINGAVPIGGDDTGLVIEGGLRVGVAFGELRNHWVLR